MQGYEDRRTINGVAHPTFKAACVTMGLLENDRELIRCLEEISLKITLGITRFTSLRVLDVFSCKLYLLNVFDFWCFNYLYM